LVAVDGRPLTRGTSAGQRRDRTRTDVGIIASFLREPGCDQARLKAAPDPAPRSLMLNFQLTVDFST
jgi:hypothetical protein